jgi:hypothetical protein
VVPSSGIPLTLLGCPDAGGSRGHTPVLGKLELEQVATKSKARLWGMTKRKKEAGLPKISVIGHNPYLFCSGLL